MMREPVTCKGCHYVVDEPWAGRRQICHRCMAPGECQGYAVGFDQIWTSPAPIWCARRSTGADAPAGEPIGESRLLDPPVFESRGEVHPGAMDAPMAQTKAAASERWAEIAQALRSALPGTEK